MSGWEGADRHDLLPRILFVADAGPTVGGGHVMRCLTLARALEDEGAACAFVATPAVAAVLDAFGADVARIAAGPAELAAAAARAVSDFDAVVIDHYGLAAPDHRAIAAGRPALVIDDLADRPWPPTWSWTRVRPARRPTTTACSRRAPSSC